MFDGVGKVRVGIWLIVRGQDDSLLIRADKGANSRGAEWILGKSEDSGAILEAAGRGEIDTLLVFGDVLDPEDTPRIDEDTRGKVESLIYVGPFLDATARGASLLLPAPAWSEADGSLVNFEGRVQWVRRCHRPRGEGRPGWRIAADLAGHAAVELPNWSRTADVLQALADSVEPYRGVTEPRLGLLGISSEPRPAATA